MTSPGPGNAAKQGARARALAARAALSAGAVAAARTAVAGHVLSALDTGAVDLGPGPGAAAAPTVAGYLPLRTEPGSTALLDALAGRGLRVLVPVTHTDRDLGWRVHGAGPTADLGTAAVAAAALVLVPALAVGPDGARLGRGGGSYDRALPRTPGLRVALLHDGELWPAVPVDPWDQPVHAAVTPAGWTWLRRP